MVGDVRDAVHRFVQLGTCEPPGSRGLVLAVSTPAAAAAPAETTVRGVDNRHRWNGCRRVAGTPYDVTVR